MNAYGMHDAPTSRIVSAVGKIKQAAVRRFNAAPMQGELDLRSATRIMEAFKRRGYQFRLDPCAWRVSHETGMSAAGEISYLDRSDALLVMLEALSGAARAEWALQNGCTEHGRGESLVASSRTMDMATGLHGRIEDVNGHYVCMLSDPLTTGMPAWVWPHIPDALEGDRIRVYTVDRALACGPALDAMTANPSWHSVVGVARKELVRPDGPEDDVAPGFGRG